MEVQMLPALPAQWTSKKPIDSYETRFLYIGFSRYDTTKQVLTKFIRNENGTINMSEAPHTETFFARCYHTENARVNVYSLNPRVWTEEVDTLQCFVQQPIHTACT
jgi:hypothetical protein